MRSQGKNDSIPKLKHAPLKEVILEFRWQLTPADDNSDIKSDTNYRLLVGKFSDRVQSTYPEYEALPSSRIPDEFIPYNVQHRFRTRKDGWPLVQLGPGILTVNETTDYTWEEFRQRANKAIGVFYDAYPDLNVLKPERLVLRYIDTLDFDFINEDVFMFLKEKMNLRVGFPENLFEDSTVRAVPRAFNLTAEFPCKTPSGIAILKFSSGMSDNRSVLVWETIVISMTPELVALPQGFDEWINAAHDIPSQWFRKITAGELYRSFNDE
jgi:uncharacterized protein (TIGR04255 family)